MKYRMLALLLLSSVRLLAGDIVVGPNSTGNDFLSVCGDHHESNTVDAGLKRFGCNAWMSGVLSGFKAYQETSGVVLMSVPANMTVVQAEKIAVMYMNDHPIILHMSASALVLRSLESAFPPPKK